MFYVVSEHGYSSINIGYSSINIGYSSINITQINYFPEVGNEWSFC